MAVPRVCEVLSLGDPVADGYVNDHDGNPYLVIHTTHKQSL